MPITGRLTVRNFSWKLFTRALHRELPSRGCTDSAGIHDDFILDGTRSPDQFGNGTTGLFRLSFFFFLFSPLSQFNATLISIKQLISIQRAKYHYFFCHAENDRSNSKNGIISFLFPFFDVNFKLSFVRNFKLIFF